jgi:antitoxin (DNA-binding transcriptional repressor) of toxin-antitoxin stability system
MRAVTIKHAKAHLNELVEAATSGEQIVLMRGSKHVAAIVPLGEADLEISPRLTDDQAARLWGEIARAQVSDHSAVFPSAARAVAFLRTPKPKARRKVRA